MEDAKHEFLEPQVRAVPCEVRAIGGRSLTFTASTERVARDGDIIEVAGWDTKEFMRNPVFLWAHDSHMPPIGRVTATRKVKTKGEERRLEVDVDFAGLEQSHELAESVYRLYRDGFMKAVSVGFQVRGYRAPDSAERETLGLGPYGQVITAAELLEVSAVPVPADPGALMTGGREFIGAGVREDLVRMRDAASAEDRGAWQALIPEDDQTDDEPDIDERILTAINALRIEIPALIDSAFQAHRDGLRTVPETPAETERDEDDSDDIWGLSEAFVLRLKQKE